MRGEYRAIHVALTTDPDFIILSVPAKTLWFVLKLHLGASGIDHMPAHRHQLAQITRMNLQAIDKAKIELRPHWLIYEGDILWLRNGLHHEPNITLENEKHRKGILNHLRGLPVQPIVRTFCDYYELEDITDGKVNAMRMPLVCPPKDIPEQEEDEKEVDKKELRSGFEGEFDDLVWPIYPGRGRESNPKKEARQKYVARREEGISLEDLRLATRGYHQAMKLADKVGTQYVMQAKTFFGVNDRWVEYAEQERERMKLAEKRAKEMKVEVTDAAAQPTEEELAERRDAVAAAVVLAKEELNKARVRKLQKEGR